MDEFAKFGGYALENNNISQQDDEFAQFGGYSVDTQPQKQYSYGNRAASLAKSAVAGAVGSVPDTAALAYNLPAMGANYLAKKGLPLFNNPHEYQGANKNA